MKHKLTQTQHRFFEAAFKEHEFYKVKGLLDFLDNAHPRDIKKYLNTKNRQTREVYLTCWITQFLMDDRED